MVMTFERAGRCANTVIPALTANEVAAMADSGIKTCKKCHRALSLAEYHRDAGCPGGHRARCRDCCNERNRQYHAANTEVANERTRQWRATHTEVVREANRQYYAANAEAMRDRTRQWREANPEARREYERRRYADLLAQVLAYYSETDPPSCACPGCGATENLSIDHVGAGGSAHREELFGHKNAAGKPFYQWLVKNDFPDDPPLQVLCLSCNHSKNNGDRCRLNHSGGD
jgi:hypothetical protein